MVKFSFTFVLAGVLALACSSKPEKKVPLAAQAQEEAGVANEYPDLVFTLVDGENVSARALEGNHIFIFFQPDCRHCQIEAINIEQRLDAFSEYTLYFISSSELEAIQAFGESFDLDDKDNVRFGWASTESVLSHYGPIQTPSVYIYANGKLKQSFNGQTDIENIIGAL